MTKPTYIKIKESIQQKIENGELVPGDALPSERTLAEKFGLSRMTVRAALTELVSAGALYREQGRGTFVSARKMKQRNIASFSEPVMKMGFTPSTKIIDFSVGLAPAEIAGKLMVEGKVYRALRVRMADDIPVAIEEVFLPLHICPSLKLVDLKLSLYKLIDETFSHKIGSVDSGVSARHPGSRQQEILKITRNTPVLKIDSLYYSVSGEPLYYERAIYRADMYEYNIRISSKN